mmetsp:Transcript_30752/g.74978  ORF Transcript_30752/g.74978 Transcript_30752/m.74978 type:complete len:723 (-) Transcript_30752:255-2423(-)
MEDESLGSPTGREHLLVGDSETSNAAGNALFNGAVEMQSRHEATPNGIPINSPRQNNSDHENKIKSSEHRGDPLVQTADEEKRHMKLRSLLSAPLAEGTQSRQSQIPVPDNQHFQTKFRGSNEPFKFWVRFRIFSISEIDGNKQEFKVRGLEEVVYHVSLDEKQRWLESKALTPLDEVEGKTICDPSKLQFSRGQASSFEPDYCLQIFGQNAKTFSWNGTLRSPDGSSWLIPFQGRTAYRREEAVLQRTRIFEAIFGEPFELHNFPFDRQCLTMSFQFGSAEGDFASKGKPEVEIHLLGGHNFSRNFVAPQGEFSVVKDQNSKAYLRDSEDHWIECIKYPLEHLIKDADVDEVNSFFSHERLIPNQNVLQLTVFVQRNWLFYFFRMLLILGLIILLSTFALIFRSFPDAMEYLMTVELTVVAYLYIVGDLIPAVKYVTVLDMYVYGSTFFVFGVMIQTGIIQAYVDFNDLDDISLWTRYWIFLANVIFYFVIQGCFYIFVVKFRSKNENDRLFEKFIEIQKGKNTNVRRRLRKTLREAAKTRLENPYAISEVASILERLLKSVERLRHGDEEEQALAKELQIAENTILRLGQQRHELALKKLELLRTIKEQSKKAKFLGTKLGMSMDLKSYNETKEKVEMTRNLIDDSTKAELQEINSKEMLVRNSESLLAEFKRSQRTGARILESLNNAMFQSLLAGGQLSSNLEVNNAQCIQLSLIKSWP